MIIRNFIKDDLPQVLELCREVRQYHIDMLGGYFNEQNDELEQIGFLKSLSDDSSIALVAVEQNTIYGYLLAERKYSIHLKKPNIVHISNIGVKGSCRTQGIGKKLMDALFAICEKAKIDEIRLGVFDKNITARKFYEKYGFKTFEQRMHLPIKKK